MPFDGSGIFQRIYNWTNDAANSVKILASRMDGEFANYADGLTQLNNLVTNPSSNNFITYQANYFTGNGTQTSFACDFEIESHGAITAIVGGVVQFSDSFTITTDSVVFSEAPPDGVKIEIRQQATGNIISYDSDYFTGNGTETEFECTFSIESEGDITVNIGGIIQFYNSFSVNENTVIFSEAPPDGVIIEIKKQTVA